jgi:hypothetical protein
MSLLQQFTLLSFASALSKRKYKSPKCMITMPFVIVCNILTKTTLAEEQLRHTFFLPSHSQREKLLHIIIYLQADNCNGCGA